ncbi:transcription initiation factor TFIID subunit 12 [Colletotrichum truncatum]|uniref:Transcription initiation factor TFIID subunit 12 n=1 Tax=Colletotrichum truncatum TaxID=5467 RepID=A0ACC3YTB3_COLTU|nr:transcription initiation factor TFIID subunit 12 [Colletotrichum truncatum]KAF6798369.1 transcription initiation factor TFIID subunit 12 [Colletotrichum truncatum]
MKNSLSSNRGVLGPKASRIQKMKGSRQNPRQSLRHHHDSRPSSTTGSSHIPPPAPKPALSQPRFSEPMYRPEMMRNLPHLTDEEKAKYERGLHQLWNHYETHPEESAQHKDAKQKIRDFTKMLLNKLQKKRMEAAQQQQQQSEQADQSSQVVPGSQQSQQSHQHQKLQEAAKEFQESLQHRGTKWSTISRDCTMGMHAMEAELLIQFGKRLRSSSREPSILLQTLTSSSKASLRKDQKSQL